MTASSTYQQKLNKLAKISFNWVEGCKTKSTLQQIVDNIREPYENKGQIYGMDEIYLIDEIPEFLKHMAMPF